MNYKVALFDMAMPEPSKIYLIKKAVQSDLPMILNKYETLLIFLCGLAIVTVLIVILARILKKAKNNIVDNDIDKEANTIDNEDIIDEEDEKGEDVNEL